METIILAEPHRLVLTDTPVPSAPPPGHALVRVHRVGVCGTDLHAFRGHQTFFTYPRILGHELGVEVAALAAHRETASPVQVGDHCAVEAYLHCGQCIACRVGRTNCCVQLQYFGVHIDGGMRPWMIIPLVKLHPSPQLSLDQLALVEMLTIGAHAVDRAEVQAEEWALVIGVGPIGLSVVQFAQAAGARVIALDVDPHRLTFCRDHLNVEFPLLAGEAVLPTLHELTQGDLPTVVFDATGNPHSMNNSLNYLAHGGRLVFVGHHPHAITLPDPEFHRREATLHASRNSTAADYQFVIAQMECGQVNTAPWITHRAALSDVVDAFPTWLEPEARVVKAMITV
jgi:2-desacetyl-2-hydroxyethyl bacteriochlorophyllide A dehydrogenase